MFCFRIERNNIQFSLMSACFPSPDPLIPLYKVALIFEPFGDQFFHEVRLHGASCLSVNNRNPNGKKSGWQSETKQRS
jgi:hypothetical protein